ncbi:MAG: ABC transporter ATP-binding protein [Thermoanaerobaculales bacterium]|jgi:ABC-type dipeptide/oligopeptide/nickel transport system ATPase component|nr:ABC transporter ATP-binding protein [Thermoanaerobaculales bacterium]
MSPEPLLEVVGLEVAFPPGRSGRSRVLDGVSLTVGSGERVGLVGASGSGKSLTALAILGLVPEPGEIRAGEVRVDGADAAGIGNLRGGVIGLVLQEGGSALNPTFGVGFQLVETIEAHRIARGRSARQRALELLEEVALEPADAIFRAYPHQLSGGQAQRVMIALALAGEPRLVIADEPTTALDVVTQARVMDLLGRICDERGLGLLLVSHDLAALAGSVHRLVVMHDGKIVEDGAVEEILSEPVHPETRRLVAAAHRLRGGVGAA